MRTTLTLEADVARLLEEEVARRRVTFKQAVNDAIRRGLGAGKAPQESYEAPVFHAELAVGVDPNRFNQLADELEAESFALKAKS